MDAMMFINLTNSTGPHLTGVRIMHLGNNINSMYRQFQITAK